MKPGGAFVDKVALLERLERHQERLLSFVPSRLRPVYDAMSLDHRAYLITGSRGAGKTTFLLANLRKTYGLYFSADDPVTLSIPLYETVEAAFMKGYQAIFIDEVHYAKDWSLHVKALYDSFPDKGIVISDSSSILLRKGLGDLSRRFLVKRIPLLSLREYIYLKSGQMVNTFDGFETPPATMIAAVKNFNIMKLFREYIAEGFRPIFLEGSYADRLWNIIEKTIYKDIPFFVPQMSENHLRFMNAVLAHLALARIPTVNVNSLCSKWELGKRKLYQLLSAMEHTGLIRIIRKKGDTRINSVGSKIFLEEPSMYYLFDGELGNVRECLVATLLQESGRTLYASEDEQQADFEVNGLKLEVGGRNKRRKQADFVIKDNIDTPAKNTLPMWCLGFEY